MSQKRDIDRGRVRPRSRKGQITVFMIIGIILLFSTSLIFYIRAQVVQDLDTEVAQRVEDVPIEAQPIKIYVENCIQKVGREAVESMGRHGGYIDPTDSELSGTEFFVGPEPTESDGITLFDDPDTLMPYWWYLESSNTCSGNCRFVSNRPLLRKADGDGSIEQQIDLYIKLEMMECLDDFDDFKKQGFSFQVGDITPDTKITARAISIQVLMPITAVKDDKTTQLDRFATSLPINFGEIYEMAAMITQEQAEKNYLESHTMNVITMYSMPLSMDLLPPIAEFSLEPGEFNFWSRTETENRLKMYVLNNAMKELQVIKSRNYVRTIMMREDNAGNFEYDNIGTRIKDSTSIQLERNFTELEARFEYLPMWDIYLDLNGQEIVMPTSLEVPIISWLGINQYRTYYSLAYPVMVTISDPEAFYGDGYEFNFALEHNLRDNKPINTSSNYSVASPQGTLVCDEKNKNSAPVTITVKEYGSGKPVENARVSLVFGNEGCRAGITKVEEGESKIMTNLPVGLGELRVNHQDYADYAQPFFASPGKEKEITVELIPYRFMNVTVFARNLNFKDGKYVMSQGAPVSSLLSHEQYIFILERMDDDAQQGYKAFAQGLGPQPATLRLMPGEYQVRGNLIHNQTIIIPKETMEVGGGLFMSSEDIEINETIIDQWQSGSAILNNQTGLFEVTYDDLFGSSRLNLYVLRFPLPETHSKQIANRPSLEQAAEFEDYSAKYRTALEPQWIE